MLSCRSDVLEKAQIADRHKGLLRCFKAHLLHREIRDRLGVIEIFEIRQGLLVLDAQRFGVGTQGVEFLQVSTHRSGYAADLAENLVKIASEKESGWISYEWSHPQTKKIEPKQAYVKRIPGINGLIGAGVYR